MYSVIQWIPYTTITSEKEENRFDRDHSHTEATTTCKRVPLMASGGGHCFCDLDSSASSFSSPSFSCRCLRSLHPSTFMSSSLATIAFNHILCSSRSKCSCCFCQLRICNASSPVSIHSASVNYSNFFPRTW